MVNFLSLSSGSNGNCYYIGNEKSALLIDVGVGARTIKKRLAEKQLSVDTINMVLVTHDHVDHIKHLGSFTERYMKPIYTTERLQKALTYHFCTRGRLGGCVKALALGKMSNRGNVSFTPFLVPHDATETVGYFIDFYGETFTFLTDLGSVNDDAIKYAKMADNLIVESNYDVDMLVTGDYTNALKERILDPNKGHLSNEQTAELLRCVYHKELKNIFLCHLSNNNNTPNKAYESAEKALKGIGVEVGKDVMLYCLPRSEASLIFCF